jgi:very-short-patch-repair endonuclease
MIETAREFRKAPTKGEKILWKALRGRKLDSIKFRRQHPIGFFIVDFYNSLYRLVIDSEAKKKETPSPILGEGKGRG